VEVEALPVEQPFHAETLLNVGQCARLALLRRSGCCPPNKRVGSIDEGKGGKNRTRLAEREMNTGNPAPLKGIVHAG